ncbi:hypothetical protein GobsT_71150 [Gemmata obscuriglobus]|uniref:Uncharacterized protein n=1 Tax=Gemmata obscuriglobus TaxID=114 RepID=A0A2Z3H7N6_9BACT|nr:hypothetical protein [Gemmata obscuriglobus]AWM41778.1 hypothetical protein C1280_35475 [Gemmata obscuriglobus]QEG32262.1 hypothetical protein GobsT_71150 [Gemmata obscuriglobus]VTS11618.1 unnamed protein product [Gemmata obscuriglobus UQM 2246]
MKTVYLQVIHDEKNLLVIFRGADLPPGFAAFGRQVPDQQKVVVTCPGGNGNGYDLFPARVACDWLRDNDISNFVNDGCSTKGITHGF